jgi:hypothetical protein
MRHAKPFVSILVILLLTACGSVPPPAADMDTSVAGVLAWTAPGTGIALLPPVGTDVDTSGFFGGASITIQVWSLDGAQGIRELHSVPVRVEDDFYLGLWRVSAATRDRTVTRVQVRLFATGLPAESPAAEYCASQPDPDACQVGSFDAQVRNSGKNRAAPGVLDVTRVQTVPIKLFVPGATIRPTSLGELTRLVPDEFGNKVPFDDTTIRNCIVNEFTMPGQGLNALGSGLNALGSGLNALGSVGGLFLLEPGFDGDDPGILLIDPAVAGEFALNVAALYDFSFDSAILVVDDFGIDPTTGDPLEIYELDPGLLTPAAGMQQADLEALVWGDGFSHGALVLRQIVQMVEAAGFVEVAAPWGPEFRVYARLQAIEGVESLDRPYLVVAAVDTGGFETDEIPYRIQNALAGLRYYSMLGDDMIDGEGDADGFDVRRVAINMSFAIVPCEIAEDLASAASLNIDTFEDYLAALGEDNRVADDFYNELTALLLTPLGGTADPVNELVEQCQGDGFLGGGSLPTGSGLPDWGGNTNVNRWSSMVRFNDVPAEWSCNDDVAAIYVASSGNFGLSFPMYPAAWPTVVGVSSQDATEQTADNSFVFGDVRSGFSNAAEIMAPGALFELGRSGDPDATTAPDRALAYAGTSFAAPVVSVFTALDLMSYYPMCALPTTSLLTDAEAGKFEVIDENGDLALGTAVWERCYYD